MTTLLSLLPCCQHLYLAHAGAWSSACVASCVARSGPPPFREMPSLLLRSAALGAFAALASGGAHQHALTFLSGLQ